MKDNVLAKLLLCGINSVKTIFDRPEKNEVDMINKFMYIAHWRSTQIIVESMETL